APANLLEMAEGLVVAADLKLRAGHPPADLVLLGVQLEHPAVLRDGFKMRVDLAVEGSLQREGADVVRVDLKPSVDASEAFAIAAHPQVALNERLQHHGRVFRLLGESLAEVVLGRREVSARSAEQGPLEGGFLGGSPAKALIIAEVLLGCV